MKRTIPLLIAALGGFILIVSYFIPATEGWGEVTAVWFDLLAAIAFLLGGGNLLATHLKKVSDQAAGWGYSAVTVIAFLMTLLFGLAKVGSPPAIEQEHFGETFASLPVDAFPESQVTRISGEIPSKASGGGLPASVRWQLRQEGGTLIFRGWMRPNQKQDLSSYQDRLQWRSTVEQLFEQAQPPETLQGKVAYYADHQALSFQGFMKDEERDILLAMSDDPRWRQAVSQIYEQSRRTTEITVGELPDGVEIPAELAEVVSYDDSSGTLATQGPMSPEQRNQLTSQFPLARPLTGEARQNFLREIEERGGPLTEAQRAAFDKILDGTWTVEQLHTLLDAAGKPRQVPKTATEMLEEMRAGVTEIDPHKTVGEEVSLTDSQVDLLRQFANDREMTIDALVDQLEASEDPFTEPQQQALVSFLEKAPTVGERNKMLCLALLDLDPLTAEQRDFLLVAYREQSHWRSQVGELFAQAHVPKYEWSGSYRAQGSPFWWMYEYVFKPLTATMFAMLAFYVASAAFRAFRAKNFEAILLLGTAFIILLGRTFAGVVLASWLRYYLQLITGAEFAWLRIENLTVTIMSLFNTAGNRAIMIGIALGIASTSLKVLLGIDRSYLGTGED